MPKTEQKGLSSHEKVTLIQRLHEMGKEKWLERWREHIAIPYGIDPESTDEREREKVLRYALLRSVINQQAVAEKARELPRRLYETFGESVLFEPQNVVSHFAQVGEVFRTVGGPKGGEIYHVGALGGIKPLSLLLYRPAAFAYFIQGLEGSIYSKARVLLEQDDGARILHQWLRDDSVLQAGWVGNDPKACRMVVNWFLFLFCEIWKEPVKVSLSDTLMIVDGHVAKVFVRSGLLNTVQVYKGSIIYAQKMRGDIETLVAGISDVVPFYVDNGAFYLFEDGFDTDIAPQCETCPVTDVCLKYVHWTAYKESGVPIQTQPTQRKSSRKTGYAVRELGSLFEEDSQA